MSVGSLNSLQDYLNSALGLIYDKKFKVVYRNFNEHREVQMADLVSNVIFGYYNFRSPHSTYNKIPAMKTLILSKFPYKYFKEPIQNISSKQKVSTSNFIDEHQIVWYNQNTRPENIG